MRSIALCLVGMLVGACARPALPPAPPPSQSHVEDAIVLADKTVALIRYGEDADAHPYCTGVWVGQNAILTAYHCVDDNELGDVLVYATRPDVYAGTVRLPVVIPHGARYVAYAEDHDLALLTVTAPPVHGIAITALGPIQQGAFAQAMGHSLGSWWSYSNGAVASVRQVEVNGMDCLWIQAAVPISPGNSGGGLFDEDGHLIGIAHASYANSRAQLLNLFIHRDYIAEFLKGRI